MRLRACKAVHAQARGRGGSCEQDREQGMRFAVATGCWGACRGHGAAWEGAAGFARSVLSGFLPLCALLAAWCWEGALGTKICVCSGEGKDKCY